MTTLGLVAALGQLGTAGVIAPVIAVNDVATVPFTLGLHERLASGATASQALREARLSADAVTPESQQESTNW